MFRAKLKSRTAFGYYLARKVPDTAFENTPAGHIFAARAILVDDVAGFAELAAIERRPWELERRWQELVRDEMVFLEAAKEQLARVEFDDDLSVLRRKRRHVQDRQRGILKLLPMLESGCVCPVQFAPRPS